MSLLLRALGPNANSQVRVACRIALVAGFVGAGRVVELALARYRVLEGNGAPSASPQRRVRVAIEVVRDTALHALSAPLEARLLTARRSVEGAETAVLVNVHAQLFHGLPRVHCVLHEQILIVSGASRHFQQLLLSVAAIVRLSHLTYLALHAGLGSWPPA